MITTDFAPNEFWDDAWLSSKLLLQPWRWKKGEETEIAKELLKNKLRIKNDEFYLNFFLSGRSALYFLLKSLNLQKNSEVIVQAFTCEAVVLPIIANNLKPIFIDVEDRTFSMELTDLKKKLTNKNKVLILQHSFGLTPFYRAEILKLSKEKNLIVIEDLAHCFAPNLFSRPNLSLSTYNYYLLSFGRSKAISSVFGGAVLSTNNKTMNQLNDIEKNLSYPSFLFILRCLLYKPIALIIKSTYDIFLGKIIHKIANILNLLVPEISQKEKEGEFDEKYSFKYPNALAALLLNQLQKFDHIENRRINSVNYYKKHLKNVTSYIVHIKNLLLSRYPVLVENRTIILLNAKKQNLFLGQWYNQVVAPKELDLKKVGYRPGSCPKAEIICKKIINLPTNISELEVERVVRTLNDVISNGN